MLRYLCQWLLLVVLGLQVLAAQVQAQVRVADVRVVIVNSDTGAGYMDAAQALMDGLDRGGVSRYDVRQLTVAEMAAAMKDGQIPKPKVFVTLGTEACALLANAMTTAPVLNALIPRNSFERVLRNSGKKLSSQFTALNLDQPLSRQLALIRLALPAAQRVGILWGPESKVRAEQLRSLATAAGLGLSEAVVDSQKSVFPGLKQVLEDSDVLLALADTQVYNSNSLQNILLATFREKVPVVAFSPAYVRAGALLSLHVTPVQAGSQAGALVLDVLNDRPLPAVAIESGDFEVVVNEHVARALNLSLDGRALRLELRRLEHLP